MTLIIARSSLRYALMVTDRRLTVTTTSAVFDPVANKNVILGSKNAVVAIGYTGMAYIDSLPTDQWIAQVLTGLTFPEGRRGRGTVPVLMTTHYENNYLGVSIQNLRDRFNELGSSISRKYRHNWITMPFDLIITGFEWNHGKIRPYLRGLSKPRNDSKFELSGFSRHWYVPQRMEFPTYMLSAPDENLKQQELERINKELRKPNTWHQIANDAEKIISQTIQNVSAKLNVVGPDTLSILISNPREPNPVIRIRYIPIIHSKGILLNGKTQNRNRRCRQNGRNSRPCLFGTVSKRPRRNSRY